MAPSLPITQVFAGCEARPLTRCVRLDRAGGRGGGSSWWGTDDRRPSSSRRRKVRERISGAVPRLSRKMTGSLGASGPQPTLETAPFSLSSTSSASIPGVIRNSRICRRVMAGCSREL